MQLLAVVVFLTNIVIGLCCQLSSECDSACTTLQDLITSKRETVLNSRYRLQYHVAPPIGWMNDPNGFVYYQGKYHIFYQFYPYGSDWGPMHWGHSTSTDLVNWSTELTALVPGTEQCFSGSAVVLDTTLVLMYTGHINGNPNDESQYLAFSDDGSHFTKYAGNPVLIYNSSLVPDFRDPKVWKHDGYWYVVIGSKTADNRGKALLYRSLDLVSWTYLSTLGEASSNLTQSAYMWECPDFFELGGKFVLMMSPQGMNQTGDRYKNLHQTGYILGSFSYTTFQFVPDGDFQEIDYGHDFYATQSTEQDGKRIFIAWFGMWETTFPEKADGWAGALTIFRELQLNGTRILMKPVDNMVNLRDTVAFNGTLASTTGTFNLNATGELIINADWANPVQLLLAGRTTGGGSVTIKWDPTTGKVIVDRANDIRQVEWARQGSLSWRLFMDTSSIELFCGDGEVVFSSRVYPLGGWQVTNVGSQSISVVAYSLKRSVPL